MYDTEEIFFLTAAEYAILLAGKGVRQHYSMCLRNRQPSPEELGKKEICLAMNRLYQTGLIDSDMEQFFIQETLDGLLTTIKEAERLFLVRFGREEHRDFCCFVKGEELTLLRVSERDENSYEISGGSKEALAAELEKSLETNLLLSVEEIAPGDGIVRKRRLVCFSEQGICCDGKSDLNEIKQMVREMVEKGED